MEHIEEETFQEELIDMEEMKREIKHDLPSPLIHSINRHNDILNSINAFEEMFDSLTPTQYAKLEHYYNKAEREAWKIAGYYKSQYAFYFGKASTERGNSYVYERETNKRAVNDSNYMSRIEEGKHLQKSGIYEGYYVTWKGIAQSYNGMQNTLKDVIKAVKAEGGE